MCLFFTVQYNTVFRNNRIFFIKNVQILNKFPPPKKKDNYFKTDFILK